MEGLQKERELVKEVEGVGLRSEGWKRYFVSRWELWAFEAKEASEDELKRKNLELDEVREKNHVWAKRYRDVEAMRPW